MRSLRLVIALMLPSAACGGPLPVAETPTEVSATLTADASISATPAYHLVTVSLCARDEDGCRPIQTEVTVGDYRVAVGSSAGSIRTRAQAISDVYRELRDRSALATKLVARIHRIEPRRVDGATATAPAPPRAPRSSGDTGSSDQLIEAAQRIVDAVDQAGEVTLDTSHGASTCRVLLGEAGAADPEAGRCLLVDTEHPGRRESEGTRHGGDTRAK